LFDPTIDATNWRAEHAIRPAVVTRKVCGEIAPGPAPTVIRFSPASRGRRPNAS
jgi:hypothetical protein